MLMGWSFSTIALVLFFLWYCRGCLLGADHRFPSGAKGSYRFSRLASHNTGDSRHHSARRGRAGGAWATGRMGRPVHARHDTGRTLPDRLSARARRQ